MKKYLIGVKAGAQSECTTINGDSRRPFMIAHNLWNYTTPGRAAQRLEKIARIWENNGLNVTRIFGGVSDMPTCGNEFNIEQTLVDYNASSKTYRDIIREYYHY